MVHLWSSIYKTGILIIIIKLTTVTETSNLYDNTNAIKNKTTDNILKDYIKDILTNHNDKNITYMLVKKHFIEKLPLTNNNNILEFKNLLNLPYSYDILKTNITNKIINYSNSFHSNESYPLNFENNFSDYNLNKNNSNENISNSNNKNILPSFFRALRMVKNEKSNSSRRQRKNDNRLRHSKRVNILKPVNYLLPPNNDYTELTSSEIQPLKTTYKQYRKLLEQHQQELSLTKNLQSDTRNLYKNLAKLNYDNNNNNNYKQNISSSRIEQNYRNMNNRYKNSPSFILKPPVITFTTSDHIFYVTPKFMQKLQTVSATVTTTASTPIMYLFKSSTNNHRLQTTASYDNSNNSNNYNNNNNTLLVQENLDNYYTTTTTKNKNNLIYKTNTISTAPSDTTVTTSDWLMSSLPQKYLITPEQDILNRTINTTATGKIFSSNKFGLKNLSLYYFNNNNYNSEDIKDNYYLPLNYTSTVSPTSTNEYILSKLKQPQIPILEINSMLKKELNDGVSNNNSDRYDVNKFTPVPLLSADVEKAGMKIYKLNDKESEIYLPSANSKNSNLYNESNKNFGLRMRWTQIKSIENNKESNNNNSNHDNDKNYGEDKDLKLSVAETTHYRRPTTLLKKPSQYIPQQTFVLHRHVIPGAAGEDYPTLSRPPINSRFSCKNDGRRYIADISSGCQVFFMCVGDGPGEAMLCPNGTLFSQDFLVCDWWYNVDCH